jgi:hypothetical protein
MMSGWKEFEECERLAFDADTVEECFSALSAEFARIGTEAFTRPSVLKHLYGAYDGKFALLRKLLGDEVEFVRTLSLNTKPDDAPVT